MDDSPKGRRSSRRHSIEDTSEDRRSTRSRIQEEKDSKKRTTRGSLSKDRDKGEMYLVKGTPKIIRKTKEAEKEAASRKRTHSQLDDEKTSSAKKSKVSDIVDRITTKRDAAKSKEEKEAEEEDENDEEDSDPKLKKIPKIDPYSPDFSATKFATWLKDGKKGNRGWKKAEDSPKSAPKKSPGKGWIKVTSSGSKDDKGLFAVICLCFGTTFQNQQLNSLVII